MARKSLGVAASGATDVLTRAEVQALVAAAGGGGGTSEALSRVRPPINGSISVGVNNSGTFTPNLNQARLALVFLPRGTYDLAFARIETVQANGLVKYVAYAQDVDAGLGSLLFDTATVPTSSGGNVGITLPSPLVVPAAGAFVWLGLVNQGTAAAGFWGSYTGYGLPKITGPGVLADLAAVQPTLVTIDSLTGAAPATPTFSYPQGLPVPRIGLRRSA